MHEGLFFRVFFIQYLRLIKRVNFYYFVCTVSIEFTVGGVKENLHLTIILMRVQFAIVPILLTLFSSIDVISNIFLAVIECC